MPHDLIIRIAGLSRKITQLTRFADRRERFLHALDLDAFPPDYSRAVAATDARLAEELVDYELERNHLEEQLVVLAYA